MTAASLSLVRTVDQATIDRYAQASGDFNPIHVDPVYAAKSPFGRTIAHGLMTLAYVADMLNRWSGGRFDEAGEIEVTFVGPVFVGDTVEISGAAEEHVERDGQECLRIKLRVTAGERLILTGYAIHPDTKTGS
ncbi:MaoC family dehydratase [Bosea sp. NPDC055594]